MKRLGRFIFAWLGLAVCASYGRTELILDHKLPVGWKYKSFRVSRSGYRALLLFPDLPDLTLLTKETSRRLQVFDKVGNMVRDTILEDWNWLAGFTGDDKLILAQADEYGCSRIDVLEPEGRVLFTADAGGRWPSAALFGHEIQLVPGPSGDLASCSIIDARTGIEKFRIGPLSKTRPDACFASIGEDGLYIAGIEKSLFLRSYRRKGKENWRIEDVGGTIEHHGFLDNEHFAVYYRTDDFDTGRFMAGNAVIKWRSGDVVFNKRGVGPQSAHGHGPDQIGRQNILDGRRTMAGPRGIQSGSEVWGK